MQKRMHPTLQAAQGTLPTRELKQRTLQPPRFIARRSEIEHNCGGEHRQGDKNACKSHAGGGISLNHRHKSNIILNYVMING